MIGEPSRRAPWSSPLAPGLLAPGGKQVASQRTCSSDQVKTPSGDVRTTRLEAPNCLSIPNITNRFVAGSYFTSMELVYATLVVAGELHDFPSDEYRS